jgi:hypothetical protein
LSPEIDFSLEISKYGKIDFNIDWCGVGGFFCDDYRAVRKARK